MESRRRDEPRFLPITAVVTTRGLHHEPNATQAAPMSFNSVDNLSQAYFLTTSIERTLCPLERYPATAKENGIALRNLTIGRDSQH